MVDNNRSAEYACALIIKDRKMLLGRRAHFRAAYPNCWDFIGGKIEEGETAEQALTRELGEEIAISPSQPSYFDKIKDIHADNESPPIYHFFKVYDWSGGEPKINNHEHSHLEWFTLEQVCDLSNLALPEYRKLLRSSLAS
ncbi:MAG: NUDIX domain-containing protein [Aliishimia sp.]